MANTGYVQACNTTGESSKRGMYISGYGRDGSYPYMGCIPYMCTYRIYRPVYIRAYAYVYGPAYTVYTPYMHTPCIHRVYRLHTLYIAIWAWAAIPVYALYGIGLFYAGFAYTAGPV